MEFFVLDSDINDPQIRLMKDLMKDYDPFVLPVKNPHDKVTLRVDVNPILVDDLVRLF